MYRQRIRQRQYQQLKVEGHLRACDNVEFRIFSLLQMRSQDTNLSEAMKRGSSKNSKQNQINYDEKLTLEKFTKNLPL